MTQYTGKCVNTDDDGNITSVQVIDIAGNSLPLSIEQYINKKVKPNYTTLPNCKN